MDRAGVKQTAAIKITGHKTPSMWRRATGSRRPRKCGTWSPSRRPAIRAQQEQARNVVELRLAAEGQKA